MATKNQASAFIRNFAERAGISIYKAHKLKQAFVHALQQEVLTHNKQVVIQDLGTFYKGHRKATKRFMPFKGVDGSGHTAAIKAHDYLAFSTAKCNRKYESDQLVFEEIARLETDGSVSVAGIDYQREPLKDITGTDY